ncbi:DUF1845 family protein [Chromobacterium haemolyticum]|uniref:DUF1845 family protein n=1 Tax=Chromobacterium fluminis TaxID=3044269 RepID=A0ABX0KYE1_9NEIS|nr:AcaB family transcriptional regulator [Chromobacterium haemolyticum]NHR04510.1 DUF1845 family protein [Chromobacterium haemolyticum]
MSQAAISPRIVEHVFDKEWRNRVNGFYQEKQVEFGSPVVSQMFKRNYILSVRNMHFISIFAEHLIKDAKQVAELAKILQNSVSKATSHIDNALQHVQAIAADADISLAGNHTSKLAASAPFTSPVAYSLLTMFEKADRYHDSLVAAWIQGEVPDDEKRKAEEDLKKTIRRVFETTRTVMGTALSRIKKEKEKAGAELSDEVQSAVADIELEAVVAGDHEEADSVAVAEATLVLGSAEATDVEQPITTPTEEVVLA